ncbi:MAG: response regulator transcription factor [Sulfurovum sp.]|nr:response regulator transcription factor [Sulfurovum sp.]
MSHTKIEDITILIAEDEKKLLDSMVEYLQIFFAHVYAVEDGESAYVEYNRLRPDIIIADIHMPHLDGLSLIRKIRCQDKQTRIIITTAHSDKEKLLDAIELNLVKYLIKPVQSDKLKQLLFNVVEEIRAQRSTIVLGKGLFWDKEEQRLLQDSKEINLNPSERKVLSLLIDKRGRSVSAIDIFNTLYEDQPERDYSSHAVTSLIKRLRQKLPEGIIKNVYGVGYIFLKK